MLSSYLPLLQKLFLSVMSRTATHLSGRLRQMMLLPVLRMILFTALLYEFLINIYLLKLLQIAQVMG